MDFMFWIWLAVIVVTAVVEFATMEIVSIWFTFGAIIPFIMAATNSVSWEAQIVVFIVISALLIASLRSVTRKFLFKGNGEKTNLEMYIGMQYRMISRTDFETIGAIKINDVIWSAVGLNRETIEEGAIVQVIDIDGNKLIVRELIKNDVNEDKFDFDKEEEVVEQQETPVVTNEVKVEETPVEVKKTSSTKKSTNAGKKVSTNKSATKTTTKKTSSAKVSNTKSGSKVKTSEKPATKSVSTKSTKTASTKQTAKKTVKKGDNK